MKTFNTKRGAQNVATRLNKIESQNKTFAYWQVESIVINNEFKYYVETETRHGVEIYGDEKMNFTKTTTCTICAIEILEIDAFADGECLDCHANNFAMPTESELIRMWGGNV
jgi:hypothetical protein